MRIFTENEIKRPGLAHFTSAEHLPGLLEGNLSLAHAPSFRKGGKDPGGRFDEDEGFISIGNPSNTRIWVGIEPKPGTPVPISQCHELTSLVGKPKFQIADNAQIHIMCFTAFDLDEQRIDARLAHNRDYLVFFNIKPFLERFDKAAVDAGLGLQRGYVEYIDDSEVRQNEVFFAKTIEYAYQKEVRFAVHGHPSKDRLTLRLGNLRDIVRVQDLKASVPKSLK